MDKNKDIHNIANILASDPHLAMNWLHFFHALDIPSHDILQLNNGFKNGTVTTYELLHRVLEIWISTKPRATPEKLINVLVQAGYYYAADNLTEYFARDKTESKHQGDDKKLNHSSKSFDDDAFFHGIQPLVVNFTGREQELKVLFGASKDAQMNIFKITGMGGLGKTTLARKFAHDIMGTGEMNCIWVDCDGIKTLKESVKGLATALKLSVDSNRESLGSVINQATQLSKRKTVLIMDNIDDVNDDITAILEQLNRNKVFVVVTSRDITVLKFGGKHLRLKTLLDHEAIELVRSGLKSEKTEDILKLCQSMQNYPLALQQAIATIIQEQHFNQSYNINEYLVDLQNNEKKEFFFNQDLINLFHHQYTKTTLSTWDVTIDKLSKQDDKGRTASKILKLLAWCKPENVKIDKLVNPNTLSHLASGEITPITKTSIHQAIRLLQTYSFIDFDPTNRLISIHRLIQEVVKLKFISEQSIVFSALLQAYDICYDILPSSFGAEVVKAAMIDDSIIKTNSEVVVRMLRLRRIPLKTKEEMVKRLSSLIAKEDSNFHHTIEAEVVVAESLMNKKGHHEEGMQWWKTIISKLDNTLDEFHPTTLNSLRLYAGQLSRLKRYEEEAGIWEVIVNRGTQVWRENDHWTLMKCVFALGNSWQKAGNFDKSLTYLTEFYKYSSTASSIEARSSEYDAENLISGILRSRGKSEAEIEAYLDSV